MLTTSLAGVRVARDYYDSELRDLEEKILAADDPLAEGFSLMLQGASNASGWHPELPGEVTLPRPFRTELARLLATIGTANRFRNRALQALPVSATPQLLIGQALEGNLSLFDDPDFRRLLPLLDQEALAAGMQDLVAAVEDFEHFLRTATRLPRIEWEIDSPLGRVIVDTTGTDKRRVLEAPLLLVDVGGNDDHVFRAKSTDKPISIVLDVGGDDSYLARDTASCPASAVMGYGILWDSAGNDRYVANDFAQSAALFGAALLFDGGGSDQFDGRQFVQSHAVGGFALLVKRGDDDRYIAINRSQASAGPRGVAVLLDEAGDDQYTLLDSPVLLPSAQLADQNLSMGQGAASGIRAEFSDGISLAGGVGLLMDLAGNDRYSAQVFAQGSAYFNAVGLLVDGGGNDEFRGRWYVQGAAAHNAAAAVIKRGEGDDTYIATNSTSLGAAHDGSLAVFVDEGGNDRYELGTLGLGAAHDNSSALFIDARGDDTYRVTDSSCRAMGVAQLSEWGTYDEDVPNIGIFLDLGGKDQYPSLCLGSANDARWTWRRQYPNLKLRSETGAGIDGELPMPVATKPQTMASPGATDDIRAASKARARWRLDPRYGKAP